MKKFDKIAQDFLKTIVPEFRKPKATMNFLYQFSKGETFVLRTLIENDGCATPTFLASKLGASTARIAALLKTLMEKGLVTHSIDKIDKRKKIITITPLGEMIAKERLSSITVNIAESFEKMGEEDSMNFIELLKKYIQISEGELNDKKK
ncbi:MAG: MarR family transcriptional regulator [Clostridioides sp.]|jgi:DNA-binding MarR family transcriptional regulator|nr:MarR family transcriptional regulator [Clostridioides sp.]